VRTGLHALLLMVLLASGCTLEGLKRKAEGPEHLLLVFDRPRREELGVGEHLVVARRDGETFLLHAWDVERRRAHQTCGAVPSEAFSSGWKELKAAGLLTSEERASLLPLPGGKPFAGRLQVSLDDQTRTVTARRPLEQADVQVIVDVLRRWEALLRPVGPTEIPAELRVEVAIGGCKPPGLRAREPSLTGP